MDSIAILRGDAGRTSLAGGLRERTRQIQRALRLIELAPATRA